MGKASLTDAEEVDGNSGGNEPCAPPAAPLPLKDVRC